MFKDKLLHIQSLLDERESRDKLALTKYYIAKRLNKSLMTYKKELEKKVAYLNDRKPENVLKRF
jgi:hypothetical protein